MLRYDTIPRPVRRALAEWVGRLADRLTGLKGQVKDAVVEAVGRTAAEAAEAALRALFGVGLQVPARRPASPPAAYDDWVDGPSRDPLDPWAEAPDDDAGYPRDDVAATLRRAAEVAPPPRDAWSWWAVVVTVLHGIAWGLRRHAPGSLVTAAAAVAGAALLLLD
jgi:hypothetical protein